MTFWQNHLFISSTRERSGWDQSGPGEDSERSNRDQSGPGEDSAGGRGDHTGGGGVPAAEHVTPTEAAAEGEAHPTEPANHTAEGSNHPTEGEIAAPGDTEGKRTGAEPWGSSPETCAGVKGRDPLSVCPVEACTLQDLSRWGGTGGLLSLQTHHIMWGLCGKSPWENMPHV